MPQNRLNITGLILLIIHSAILQQSISNYSAIVQQSINKYSAIVQQSLSISDPQDFPTILGKCNTLCPAHFPDYTGNSMTVCIPALVGWLNWGKSGVFNCSAVRTWFVSVVEFCITYCWCRSFCVKYCWCRCVLCHIFRHYSKTKAPVSH